jgi:hypothetical protein
MPTLNDTQFKTTQTILVPYATDRFYLNRSRVEYGWLVFAFDTKVLYVIKDVDELDNEDGYTDLSAGGGGGGSWGSITGTLANQTDLQAALNAKQSTTTNLTSFIGKLGSGGSINDAQLTGTAAAENFTANQANLNSISISRTLTLDDSYAGITLSGTNAGATIAQWEVCYHDFADNELKLADADGSGTYPARGIAVTSGTDGNALTILTEGFVRNDAWNWSAGNIYISTTAGAITQTAPSTSGNIVQRIGYAVSADVAYFNFNVPYLTVA